MQSNESQEQFESIATYVYDNFVEHDIPPLMNIETNEMRAERKKIEIADMFIRYRTLVHEGAELFLKIDTEGIIKPLIEKTRNATIEEIVSFKLLNEKDFSVLMKKALEVYQAEHLNEAMSLFACIAFMFPLQVQPYISIATIIWKQSGIEKAVDIYSQLIQCLPNPLLMLYAARCFKAAGDTSKAKETLEKALKLCELNLTDYASSAKEINNLLVQLSTNKQ